MCSHPSGGSSLIGMTPGSRNIYEGMTKEGIKIQMIIRNNKVITAYPLF